MILLDVKCNQQIIVVDNKDGKVTEKQNTTQLYMEGMIIQNLIYLLNTCKRKASK